VCVGGGSGLGRSSIKRNKKQEIKKKQEKEKRNRKENEKEKGNKIIIKRKKK
jgi:hypothetical protein